MDVGIVGLGALGRALCRALADGSRGLRPAGATARDREKAERFLKGLRFPVPFLALDDLVDASSLVVEASTQAHLQEIAPMTLEAGRDLIVLSCGGLLGRRDWVELAAAHRCRILVPSAAIAGLDGVKGASVGAITSVTMETRKPPRGLAGAPWIEERKIDLDRITKETLIFEGPATEACRAFPANVNVLAAPRRGRRSSARGAARAPRALGADRARDRPARHRQESPDPPARAPGGRRGPCHPPPPVGRGAAGVRGEPRGPALSDG